MTSYVTGMRSLVAAALVACVLGCDDDGTGPTPLPAPTGVTAAQLSLTSIRVSWNAVLGAQSYVLQRASASNPGVFSQIGGTLTATTYDDAGVTAGVAYSYRVAAVAAGDTSAFSTSVTLTTGLATKTIGDDVTANRTLVADTVYVLQGYVKVQNGVTLTIQPGTKIVGDTATFGSSLWILRGAKLVANGTASAPIVFTSQRAPGNRHPGDWGGIIMIGNGIINRTGTILTEGPTGEAENYAGGSDNADSSGVLRYIRIEFAGFDVSGGGNSELNGLSMYAVGSRTVIENVEVLAGLDDSFEWWGGAVDGRYLVSYEAGDDHFDWSEGYVGRNQFLIGFQSARINPAAGAGVLATDPEGFEADGCNGAGCALGFATQPFSVPVFANFTLIGPGTGTTLTSAGDIGMVLRRGVGGYLTNSVVARWHRQGLSVRDPETNTMLTTDSLNVVN